MSNENIVASAGKIVPDTPNYMLNHIGQNDAVDRDIDYTKRQKKIIDQRNNTLYQRDQHDVTFDLPAQGYNAIQNNHPLGINMVANHADKGFDYRDFPKELKKDTDQFNPYLDYLHKNGLIGKNKFRYITNYINISSTSRQKKPSSTTTFSIKLDDNPLIFNGSDLQIAMSDTSNLSVNDKITISGITERKNIVRSYIVDDLNAKVYFFLLEESIQYMTVNVDNNMLINAGFTSDIKDQYNDIQVTFSGFIGDQKTVWFFDTTNYIWSIVPITNTSTFTFTLTENVYAVTSATALNPEPLQIRTDMLIAEFTIDQYGTVIAINQNIPYTNSDLRWTEPSVYIGQGTAPIAIPAGYQTDATNKLISLNLTTPPPLPNTFVVIMEYFQKVQNAIRPIFLAQMSTVANRNFGLRYQEAGAVYADTVRIVVPEQTKITTTSYVGNISLNSLNTTHRMYLTKADVEKDLGNTTTTADNIPLSSKFYIKLNNQYSRRKFEAVSPFQAGGLLFTVYDNVKSDVQITYRHFGGVPTRSINANFPVGFFSSSGFKYIKSIVDNRYIVVDAGRIGFYSSKFGGSVMEVGLIEDINEGFVQPNRYIVDLETVYTNAVMIRMISSEFPKSQRAFMDGLTGGVRNNKLYWQILDDGETIYQITIESGTYSAPVLAKVLEDAIRNVPRNNELIAKNTRNYMTVSIDQDTDKVIFSNFNEYIPNNVTTFVKKITLCEINQQCNTIPIVVPVDPEDLYYVYPTGMYYSNFPNAELDCAGIRIKIYHPNHGVKIGWRITIRDSLNFDQIPANYLNGTHIVTNVFTDYYDIVLNNVNLDQTLPMSVSGGVDIKIYVPSLFRLLFDQIDTMGSELGFRDVGEETSVTPYQTVITNDVIYENEDRNNLLRTFLGENTDVSDINNIVIRNSLSLDGPSHLFIVCKELSGGKGTGAIKDYFYKINLKGMIGRTIYNTYADQPIFYNEPLRRLDRLTLDFLSPDGNLYDFNGLEHSFTLEIVTHEEIPEGTSIRF
jgi:hypothetical protein